MEFVGISRRCSIGLRQTGRRSFTKNAFHGAKKHLSRGISQLHLFCTDLLSKSTKEASICTVRRELGGGAIRSHPWTTAGSGQMHAFAGLEIYLRYPGPTSPLFLLPPNSNLSFFLGKRGC